MSYNHYKCLAINKNGLRLHMNMLQICFSYEFWSIFFLPAPIVSVLEDRHIMQHHQKYDVMCDHDCVMSQVQKILLRFKIIYNKEKNQIFVMNMAFISSHLVIKCIFVLSLDERNVMYIFIKKN